MKRIRIVSIGLLTGILFSLISGCNDLLDVEPKDVLTEDEFYRDKFDADAAIRGLYGKLIMLAPQYVVLNELRADLMDVTVNADHYLREISDHGTISEGNPWADPAPFFSLINNCNNIIKNFRIMLEKRKMSREAFEPRYSDVVALRSWIYLQMVIHYGNVPYITEPFESNKDLSKIEKGEFPVYGIEEMVDKLISEMVQVPSLNTYTDEGLYRSIDGFHTRTMYIDKLYLLGELFLWDGDYINAASAFRNIMDRGAGGYGGYNIFDQYKMAYRDDAQPANPGTSRYTSGYLRFFGQDLNSVVNFWPLMFKVYGDANYYGEWLWVMHYHQDYSPSPFHSIFSITSGSYKLKPSQHIINDWENQIQANGFTGDFRGHVVDIFGNKGSYDIIGGQPVITKFIAEYNEIQPLKHPGKWYLWRAGGLHLRYIEAANRAGQHYLAHALLNNGIRASYPGSGFHGANDFSFRNVAYKTTNTGEIIYTQESPVYSMSLLTHPFNFDARQTSAAQIPTNYRGNWHRGIGVRGRVGLSPLTVNPTGDILTEYEDHIINESGRELAFEGQRWADLVRIAIRRGDNAYLANRVAAKFSAAGDNARAELVRAKLMDRANWFLPF